MSPRPYCHVHSSSRTGVVYLLYRILFQAFTPLVASQVYPSILNTHGRVVLSLYH